MAKPRKPGMIKVPTDKRPTEHVQQGTKNIINAQRDPTHCSAKHTKMRAI